MVITSESDLNLPDLINELQSSGHIINVQCNKSSGKIVVTIILIKIDTTMNFIEPPTQAQVKYTITFLVQHQVGTLSKALLIFNVSTASINILTDSITIIIYIC